MACTGCSTKDGKPGGCGNGGCASGGCNRLNTYDWLATTDIHDPDHFEIVEVSFKNGARKDFYYNMPYTTASTGDTVVLETSAGYDVGKISLSGELVRLQMRKKKVNKDNIFNKVLRVANRRDLERLSEARALEQKTMVRARAIARTLDINMKIGDVEYQGDRRKATFYYTADGRVDFRELIRHYAKEFRVKIEMRQIGARQESARIGGLGSCGRELCCSTWLSDFKSVSTAAARYQNLAINQAKLSGQCGRLKCCLNYELDSYVDALGRFPKKADTLKTEAGIATLVKTDIFRGVMYYAYIKNGIRGKFYPLDVERVEEILAENKAGKTPMELQDSTLLSGADVEMDYGDVTNVIELPPEERRKRKRRRKRNKNQDNSRGVAAGNQSKNRPDGQKDKNNRPGEKPKDRKPVDKKGADKKPVTNKTTNKKTEDGKTGDRRSGRGRSRRPDPRKKGNPPTNKQNSPKADGGQKNQEAPKKSRPKRRRPKNKPKPNDKNNNT